MQNRNVDSYKIGSTLTKIVCAKRPFADEAVLNIKHGKIDYKAYAKVIKPSELKEAGYYFVVIKESQDSLYARVIIGGYKQALFLLNEGVVLIYKLIGAFKHEGAMPQKIKYDDIFSLQYLKSA